MIIFSFDKSINQELRFLDKAKNVFLATLTLQVSKAFFGAYVCEFVNPSGGGERRVKGIWCVGSLRQRNYYGRDTLRDTTVIL